MNVFVTHLSDRHCDHQVLVFRKAVDALKQAEKWAKDGAEDNNCKVIEPRTLPDDWLYCARYSEENDSVWVTKEELK